MRRPKLQAGPYGWTFHDNLVQNLRHNVAGDALAAANAGGDAIGLIFSASPRYVTQALQLIYA